MRSATLRRHIVAVERVGNRLQAQAALAHVCDALAELWCADRESGSAARRAPGDWLTFPTFDLPQHGDGPATRGDAGVEAYIECYQLGA